MAEGKKRKRSIPKSAAGAAQNDKGLIDDFVEAVPVTELQKLEKYIEVVFYECCISAQYTANIQILFKIEDIVQRMQDGSFAATFSNTKADGVQLLEKTVSKWIHAQDEVIKTFFSQTAVRQASLVLVQRNNISCTINEKVHRLPIEGNKGVEIAEAINILRYPLVVMERIQRRRIGDLLDLEKDAAMLIELGNDFQKEAQSLQQSMKMLDV